VIYVYIPVFRFIVIFNEEMGGNISIERTNEVRRFNFIPEILVGPDFLGYILKARKTHYNIVNWYDFKRRIFCALVCMS